MARPLTKSPTIGFRVNLATYHALQRQAQFAGVSIGEYCRRWAILGARETRDQATERAVIARQRRQSPPPTRDTVVAFIGEPMTAQDWLLSRPLPSTQDSSGRTAYRCQHIGSQYIGSGERRCSNPDCLAIYDEATRTWGRCRHPRAHLAGDGSGHCPGCGANRSIGGGWSVS